MSRGNYFFCFDILFVTCWGYYNIFLERVQEGIDLFLFLLLREWIDIIYLLLFIIYLLVKE